MSENTAVALGLVEETGNGANIDNSDKSCSLEENPTNSEMATLKPPVLRVEKLKDENDTNSNFSYTSEEDCGSHASEDGDHTPEHVDGDFETPDDELRDKIIKQVEFYFSDANLLKDAFLLKHVRRNKLGYVSLKLITSFKKLKSMTKDYRVVAFSLRQSDRLCVNDEGTKVRRKDPLPEYDETTPSRSVVAVNLPTDNPSIETVADIFSKCGDIALIRILRPGKGLPPDVKKHSARHPEIGNTVCAVVEFEKYEYAKAACDMTNNQDWRNGLRVIALATPKKKEKKTTSNDKHDDVSPDDEEKGEKKKRKRGARKKKSRVDELVGDSSCCSSSGSEAEHIAVVSLLNPQAKEFDPNRLSPTPSPRSSPRNTPKSSPRSQRRNKGTHGKSPLAEFGFGDARLSPRSSPEVSRRHLDSSGADSTPSSPWVQRRIKAAQEMKDKSPKESPRLGRRNMFGSPKMLDMEGVVRLPRGPDGSEGFYGGFGRGKPRSNTVC